MKIKISDYIANFLADNGIDTVFTLTGGGAMHLNDSLGHHKDLDCVYCHHEQACAIAAEGYTRLSRKLAAVCVTTGPGGTNAITGVLGGWQDSIPMFIISGQVKRETTVWCTDVPLRQLGDQEHDIVTTVGNITKYAKMVVEANEISYHLEKALFIATHGRGGPVWLDIPMDIQSAVVDTDELSHFNPEEYQEEQIEKVTIETAELVIEKIRQAKRPVIIAGSAIRLADGHDIFLQLIEQLNIPVVTPWNAHDNVWDDHPLYCGRPGSMGTRGGNFVLENSDLILSLGCRLNIRQISYNFRNFSKSSYKIIVDIDKGELMKPTLSPDMPIHADVKDFMEALLRCKTASSNETHKRWLNWCRDTDAKYPIVLPQYFDIPSPINPYIFLTGLFRELDEGEVIVTGNGTACVGTFQAAIIKKGQRLFTNSGCASMGYGVPSAFGASVYLKGKRVICLDGDGSIMMNLQELQTIAHHQSNIKIFLLNNNGYHSIRQTQTHFFKPPMVGVSPDNGISFPEFEGIVKAFKLPYFKLDHIDHIKDIVKQCLSYDGPAVCEVIISDKQFFEPKLVSRMSETGEMLPILIDDMYPYLSKEEYQSNHFKD